MPPRTRFDREAVLAAAMDEVRAAGPEGLTARGVARRLGASIAPVYRAFDSMEALEEALRLRTLELLLACTERPVTELAFLNMGVGIAVFAREEPQLFRLLFLTGGRIKANIDWLAERLCEDMRKDAVFRDWPRDERMALLTKMWTYTHGLASLICLGGAEDDSDAFIIEALRAVGRVVSEAAVADYEARRRSRSAS